MSNDTEKTLDPTLIFVSYSRDDELEVSSITDSLRNKGHSLWIDREGIPSSAIWRDEIAFAIEQCVVLLFFVSEHSIKSEEARKELDYAVTKNKRIVPVMLRPMELSGGFALQINRIQRFERWTTDGRIDVTALDSELHRVLSHRISSLNADKDKASISGASLVQHTRSFMRPSVTLALLTGFAVACLALALAFRVINPKNRLEEGILWQSPSHATPAQPNSPQRSHPETDNKNKQNHLDRPGKISPDA
jgi:hypothetical protein